MTDRTATAGQIAALLPKQDQDGQGIPPDWDSDEWKGGVMNSFVYWSSTIMAGCILALVWRGLFWLLTRHIDNRIDRIPKPGYLGPWPPQAGQFLDSRYDYRHLPWHESVEPLRSQGFLIPDVPHQMPRWDESNL